MAAVANSGIFCVQGGIAPSFSTRELVLDLTKAVEGTATPQSTFCGATRAPRSKGSGRGSGIKDSNSDHMFSVVFSMIAISDR
jgi:hypothetical protein